MRKAKSAIEKAAMWAFKRAQKQMIFQMEKDLFGISDIIIKQSYSSNKKFVIKIKQKYYDKETVLIHWEK